jgi:hypothetical protein
MAASESTEREMAASASTEIGINMTYWKNIFRFVNEISQLMKSIEEDQNDEECSDPSTGSKPKKQRFEEIISGQGYDFLLVQLNLLLNDLRHYRYNRPLQQLQLLFEFTGVNPPSQEILKGYYDEKYIWKFDVSEYVYPHDELKRSHGINSSMITEFAPNSEKDYKYYRSYCGGYENPNNEIRYIEFSSQNDPQTHFRRRWLLCIMPTKFGFVNDVSDSYVSYNVIKASIYVE